MKIKLKNKYEEYKERMGTITKGESMTDQSQREETDIYACLSKYGASTLVNKTMAQEYLYLDNTNANMTLDEAVRIRKEMTDYFEQLPARVRKTFGDKADIFIEKYKQGEFTDFIATGVLSNEMVEALTPQAPTSTVTPTKTQDIMEPTISQDVQMNGGTTNV